MRKLLIGLLVSTPLMSFAATDIEFSSFRLCGHAYGEHEVSSTFIQALDKLGVVVENAKCQDLFVSLTASMKRDFVAGKWVDIVGPSTKISVSPSFISSEDGLDNSIKTVLDELGYQVEHEYKYSKKISFNARALRDKLYPFCFNECSYSKVDVFTRSTSLVGLKTRVIENL